MSVFKRGTYYWYAFWFKGQHIQRGTYVTSRRVALKMEAVHKAKLIEGKAELRPKKAPLFSEFASRYLEFSKANKRAYVYDRYCIPQTLVPFFGDLRLDAINAGQVEEYKQRRLRDGLKKSSINREVGLLKSALNTAVGWELLDRNPAKGVKLFKLDEPLSDRVLSHEEENKLLAACDESELRYRAPHLKPIILIALYTGLRRGEILRLRWADIDFENSVLAVRKSKTKSGQGRRVNLNSVVRDVLLSLREKSQGEWVFPSPDRFQSPAEPERHIGDVKNAFHRAVRLTGIAPITFHQLRHTFCSRLADAGVPLPVIQDLAGHASIIMTRRYTHPGNELKQKAVELLLVPKTTTKSATPAVGQAEAQLGSKGQIVQFKRVAGEPKKATGD